MKRLLSVIAWAAVISAVPAVNAQEGGIPLDTYDPSNGVLPARPAPRTLNPFQLRTMKRQLGGLVERVRAIVLSAQMQNRETQVAEAMQALQLAESVLGQLDTWLAQGQTELARQQWLQAQERLWQTYPALAAPAKPEIRAMWLDRGAIVQAGSEAGLARLFDRLQAAGVNLVFFETVNAGYPIYPSRVAPQQNPLTRGWDPLAAAVQLAKERQLELHPWVWVFAVGNQRHNVLVGQPLHYLGPVLSVYPDWANLDNRGHPIPPQQDKPFLDPAHPQAREYLFRLFEEIVTRYDVDGLHLDYIRYPFQSGGVHYGYGMASRRVYQERTGLDPLTLTPGQPQWQDWTHWRSQQVTDFVTTLSQRLKQKRPELLLSAAVFAYSRPSRLYRLQQDWETWAMTGAVDMIVLMSYAEDTRGLQDLLKPAQLLRAPVLFLPGISLMRTTPIAVLDQVQAARHSGLGPGYALFAMSHFNGALEPLMQQTSVPLPHRQPFQSALQRYQAQQQEWLFLVRQGQLPVPDPGLFQQVNSALTQLVQHPSKTHWQTARAALQTLAHHLDDWPAHPWRVDTWRARLKTIDDLLLYGARLQLHLPATALSQPLPGRPALFLAMGERP
ncbi:MAG: family 10 glycosylhydrolase [Gloeomargarita sp. SKYBB_i_bin120]|nr:family 10 glycosylhydrolase [Gloeomargarita sp. SKYG98]MCS7292513.1 family 10 glycosylhydrolase [Gloeomargarita sp. SKYB120]MDW8178074.1 family 10 glycosylhydrolase [Gloeomargarita sp. SKYBB_i_bin120]